MKVLLFFFQAEDGIRDRSPSRGLGDVYKRQTAWCAEYDEWGNLLSDENPHHLQQLIRLPGQQYDEESGLYYNRHRYYDPLQGRYCLLYTSPSPRDGLLSRMPSSA